MDPIEQIRDTLAFNVEFQLSPHTSGGMDEWARRKHGIIAIYNTLTFELGCAAGRVVLATYDVLARRERDERLMVPIAGDPVEHVQYLAVFQPAAMRALYPEALTRGALLWHGEIFCAGDVATRDALLARIEWREAEPRIMETANTDIPLVLTYLGWIGDDTIVARFNEWRDLKLLWRPTSAQSAVNPSIADQTSLTPVSNSTYEAGWELSRDGARRNLYLEHWRKLLPASDSEVEADTAPVSVGGLMGAHCSWCGRALAAILDLDLHAPELAFLGLSGDRLRIPTCRYCSYGGRTAPLYWRVDPSGAAHWHTANGERPAVSAQYDDPVREYEPEWSSVRYAPGTEHANVYASLVPAGDFNSNRLGGLPEWVQSPQYPLCPNCGRSLRFLAQFDADKHGGWEGLIYSFLCDECHVAATVHQQT